MQFALFTGLLGRNLQPPLSRHAKELLKEQQGAEDDVDSDFDLPDMSRVPLKPKSVTVQDANDDEGGDGENGTKNPPPAKTDSDATPQPFSEDIDEEDVAAFQRQVEEEEDSIADRMSSFLNNPVFSMKVFLSSHFRDKGLIWYFLSPNYLRKEFKAFSVLIGPMRNWNMHLNFSISSCNFCLGIMCFRS
jgi:hypothetical protein